MSSMLETVRPAKDASECETTWEWVYHNYRVVERRWDRLYGETEFSDTEESPIGEYSALMDVLTRPAPDEHIERLTNAEVIEGIDQQDIDLAIELRKLIAEHSSMDDWSDTLLSGSSDPYEDAYHAAIYIDTRWNRGSDSFQFYRGQRDNSWGLVPSLYRDLPDFYDLEDSKKVLEDRLTALSRLVTEIDMILNKEDYTFYETEELVAIAQHFRGKRSDIAPTPGSWLLDVTTNPLIALFFAAAPTDEGETNGVVYRFRRSWLENEVLSFTDESDFRLIMPAGIPRIQRQEAAFLELHPLILQQYLPEKTTFKQKPGVKFIDPYLGLTEYRVLNANDPLLSELSLGRFANWPMNDENEGENEATIAGYDMSLSRRSVTPPAWWLTGNLELHQDMVRGLIIEADLKWNALSETQRAVFEYIAYGHAYLQEYEFDTNEIGPNARKILTSIRRFTEVSRTVCTRLEEDDHSIKEVARTAIRSEYGNNPLSFNIQIDIEQIFREMEDEWDPPIVLFGDSICDSLSELDEC